MHTEITQNGDGQWYWKRRDGMDAGASDYESSAIAFPDEIYAIEDLGKHVTASIDDSGRRIRSKADLEMLLRLAVRACSLCNDSISHRIDLSSPGAEGCNWSVSTDDTLDCQEGVVATVSAIQAAYNLAAEG